MARQKQLLVKSGQDWLFGPKPNEKQVVFSDKHYLFDLGDISKIPAIDVFEHFFTNPIEEAKQEGMDILRMIAEPAFIWMACKILFGRTLYPTQAAIYSEIYNRPFSILCGSRGFSKTWGAGIIMALKAALTAPKMHGGPGFQAVVVGSGFRQSKLVFEYMEELWNTSPMLRSICGKGDGCFREQDRFTVRINGNKIIFIPLGNGDKIRGLRAGFIWADEINSIANEIFETVVMGFTAVSTDPISNIEYHKKLKYLKSINDIDGLRELQDTFTVHRNQVVLSGTAGHQFQPFYKYYSRYKTFIESRGEMDYLKKHLPTESIPEGKFDYRDYSICQIPYSLVKEYEEGFMDEATISKAKATMTSDIYDNEYEAIFTKDSQGFFKASVINKNTIPYKVEKVGEQIGENNCLGHLFGIDVASEFDKFAVCVLGVYPNHAKVKSVWSTNRKSFEQRQMLKQTETTEYYSFCTRKVRELMKCFPPLMNHPNGSYIGCDLGGGGIAIRESFHDLEKLRAGESPIYEITDATTGYKMSDGLDGDHCLQMISFTKTDVRNDIYFGGKKLLEDGRIKFPEWDHVSLEVAADSDRQQTEKYLQFLEKTKLQNDRELVLLDTLEDTFMEIKYTIEELLSIKVTQSATGVDQFKAESKKGTDGKLIYMHKDRATALLIAMLLYKQYMQVVDPLELMTVGGVVKPRREKVMWEPTNQLAAKLNQQSQVYDMGNKSLQRGRQ